MARTPKEIRTKLHRSGRYMVGFLEEPAVWHQSPESDTKKATAWAKRNKGRLLGRPDAALTLRPFLKDFFSPSGAWRKRMAEKGHEMSDRHLGNYQAHCDNYIDPLFGDADPRELTSRIIDDAILQAKGKAGRSDHARGGASFRGKKSRKW